MINNRSYTLKLYGSESKFEDLRYSANKYRGFVNAFCQHFYFKPWIKSFSTKNGGILLNQAQRRAQGMVASKKTNEKENGHSPGCPQLHELLCFANIKTQSSHKHFNYVINFGVSWNGERAKSRYVFAKKTAPLKKALKQGWILSSQCEVFYEEKDNHWYVRVFVSRPPLRPAQPQLKSIGIDVGINHIVTTSEGFKGNSLSKRLKKLNQAKKEKQRQLALAKNRKDILLVEKLKKNLTKNKKINKTVIKMLLDKEAKRLIASGLTSNSNLVVEDPRVLANLTGNKNLIRWTKTYLAYRLQTLGKENGIYVVTVNPAYTSTVCSQCGNQDNTNRQGTNFECLNYGSILHADFNASINLSRKGQDFVDIYVLKNKKKSESLFKYIPKSAVGTPLGPK